MKDLSRDERGLIENPYVILIIIIALLIFAVMGGLAVLYAPNIAAAAVLIGIAVLVVWKVPIADMRMRVGIFAALVIAAILIYFYGTDFLAVIA